MFNKLKQFKDMRSQAKDMQSKLAEESVTVKSNGVELTMDGNLAVDKVNIDTELLSVYKKEKLENAFISAHKDALKKIQRIMAMKMKEMGGMPNMPGMN